MNSLLAAMLVALATIPADAATRARYLMGTVCEVTAESERDVDFAFAEAARIEALISTWRDDSELARVNRGDAAVSREVRDLLRRSVEWSRKTGGAFNPLIAPLVDVWKTREDGALPERAQLARAVAKTKLGNARFDGNAIALANGAEFEEGGFGKGYALDRMLAGMSSKHAVINFGGQLIVRGATSVTIADPERRDRAVVALTLENASLSTSSGSEKQFTVNGRRFSHILDPRTGDALPPRGSVSVVASEALAADILSTALYVMGEEEGLRWADAHGIAAIFINPAREIRRSAAARAQLRGLAVLDGNFLLKD